jgi:hypothetical protein
MKYIDPDAHGKTAATLPFWLSWEGEAVGRDEEKRIRVAMFRLLGGNGSMIPDVDQRWAIGFIEGWLVLMFRTTEDRDLARFAL